MSKTVPVILCGGSGTRLWPRSRKQRPKPFLPLVGNETLFRATLLRCQPGEQFADPIVVTGSDHLVHVEDQLLDSNRTHTIIEPEARNTAAAIALAALTLSDDTVMLVCPSDHHIGDSAAFRAAAQEAAGLARQGWLVSFGITPTSPETGFGYLKQGSAISDSGGYRVDKFVEKPDLARAMAFFSSKEYAWNGGIFAFEVKSFLAELGRHRPVILASVREAVAAGRSDGMRFYPEREAFSRVPSESIDYAVMENTDHAALVPANIAWSDIGNWQALQAAQECDASGNAALGRAEFKDCRNVLVMSDGPRVSVVGATDLIIVVDGDEVLVCTPQGAQAVGKLSGAARQ